MLLERVGRLEDIREIGGELKSISRIFVEVRERLSRIEGKLDRTPDASQMWRMVVGSWVIWVAGAGIVMPAVRLLTP